MVKPPSPLKFIAVLFAAPVALLSACTPTEPVATQPGTGPPIWTGSPAPAGMMEGHGAMPDAPAVSKTLTAQINNADGTQVAAATIEFRENDAFATVTVQTTAPGLLAPGPHGLHIHAIGKCEVNSVAPTGGAPGDFLSAGGHFQGGAPDVHPNHAGDLSSLQVRGNGTALGHHNECLRSGRSAGRRLNGDHHSRECGQLRQYPGRALPADQRCPATG